MEGKLKNQGVGTELTSENEVVQKRLGETDYNQKNSVSQNVSQARPQKKKP